MASFASLIDIEGCSSANALYLGNYSHAKHKKHLVERNIRLVINVASEDPIVGKETLIYDQLFAELNIETVRFPWDDRDEFQEKLNIDEFRIAICAIDRVLSDGGSVLLHCRQGKSRSGTLAVAYIMAKTLLNVEEALKRVKTYREVAHPNDGFLRWLHKHEDELHGLLSVVASQTRTTEICEPARQEDEETQESAIDVSKVLEPSAEISGSRERQVDIG